MKNKTILKIQKVIESTEISALIGGLFFINGLILFSGIVTGSPSPIAMVIIMDIIIFLALISIAILFIFLLFIRKIIDRIFSIEKRRISGSLIIYNINAR